MFCGQEQLGDTFLPFGVASQQIGCTWWQLWTRTQTLAVGEDKLLSVNMEMDAFMLLGIHNDSSDVDHKSFPSVVNQSFMEESTFND